MLDDPRVTRAIRVERVHAETLKALLLRVETLLVSMLTHAVARSGVNGSSRPLELCRVS
jgi:hypothetical protein